MCLVDLRHTLGNFVYGYNIRLNNLEQTQKVVVVVVVVVVVYLYLTSAKCTGIAAFSLWPEATALTEVVKVELHERKKMKFHNV